jgi:hypothetical protein
MTDITEKRGNTAGAQASSCLTCICKNYFGFTQVLYLLVQHFVLKICVDCIRYEESLLWKVQWRLSSLYNIQGTLHTPTGFN